MYYLLPNSDSFNNQRLEMFFSEDRLSPTPWCIHFFFFFFVASSLFALVILGTLCSIFFVILILVSSSFLIELLSCFDGYHSFSLFSTFFILFSLQLYFGFSSFITTYKTFPVKTKGWIFVDASNFRLAVLKFLSFLTICSLIWL